MGTDKEKLMELFTGQNKPLLILTPNQRLGNTLNTEYLSQLPQANCIRTIEIVSLSHWLSTLWLSINPIESRKLVESKQEHCIWERLIDAERSHMPLLNTGSTAKTAMQAYTICQEWQIDLSNPEFSFQENTAIFQQWANQFETICQNQKLITHSQLLNQINNHLPSISSIIAEDIIFYQFLELTPQQLAFITALKKQKKQVSLVSAPKINQASSVCAYATTEKEIQAMVMFAQNRYTANPNSHIACIVPDLHIHRDAIETAFKQHFNDPMPVDFSAGKSLLRLPITQSLIELLSITLLPFSIERLLTFMLSPFIAQAESCHYERITLHQRLHQICHNQFTKEAFLLVLNQPDINDVIDPHLQSIIELLLQKVQQPQKLLPSQFVTFIKTLLNHVGWPGERTLSSEEYQMVQKIIQVLDEFSLLDTLLTPLPKSQLFKQLQTYFSQTMFQSEKKTAPIKVLGLLEAAGMSFDHAWVCQYHDMNIPTEPNPNPFIPFTLQRNKQLPRSTAGKEYTFYQQLTEQFIANSNSITFSFSQSDGVAELRASPLIKNLPLTTATDTITARPNEANRIELEHLDERYASPYLQQKLIGGTDTLKRQSVCPFQAFAHTRLNAAPLEPLGNPITPLIRGSVVHAVLEDFWKRYKNQTALLKLSDAEMTQCCADLTKFHLNHHQKKHAIPAELIALEQEHMTKLIGNWLAYEKNRQPFEVSSVERQHTIHINGLQLTIRIDRIDQLDSGHSLLIDYKTGLTQRSHWFGKRLKQPQLPLYLVCINQIINGISYAEIKPSSIRLNGITLFEENEKQLTPFEKLPNDLAAIDWTEQCKLWQTQIQQLAQDYKQGYAAVDPIDSSVCTLCCFQSLCRVVL